MEDIINRYTIKSTSLGKVAKKMVANVFSSRSSTTATTGTNSHLYPMISFVFFPSDDPGRVSIESILRLKPLLMKNRRWHRTTVPSLFTLMDTKANWQRFDRHLVI